MFSRIFAVLFATSLILSQIGLIVQSLSSQDTIVLLDNLALKETHSQFFRGLQERGYQLTFKLSDDPNLSLKKYGTWLYKNLIIFAPATDEFGGDLNSEAIAEFVDNGGNLLVTGSSNAGDAIRDLAPEFGLELDDVGAYVIDHINYNPSLDCGKHTTIQLNTDHVTAPKTIIGETGGSLLYKGSSLLVDTENPLVMELLVAPSSSYSYDPSKDVTQYPHTVGRNTVLVAALQARNNARVVFAGSLDFFSDKFFTSTVGGKQSGNEEFVKALNQWVFKEKGVLRLSNVTHHKAGEKSAPSSYTITEDVVYSVIIEELKNGVWVGYTGKDVQLEFVRIDPFVRTTLVPVSGEKGLYEARFKIPDVYGVYQFKIQYEREGYTFLNSYTQVSVRPLQHTQYERFIPGAFPYYASGFSMMIGVSIFACVFLHYKDKDKSE